MLKEDGFTLLEMLVVLLIITILILLIVPNIGNRSSDMHDDGCEALIIIAQSQADMYLLDKGSKVNSIDLLVKDQYLNKNQTTCKNGKNLIIN